MAKHALFPIAERIENHLHHHALALWQQHAVGGWLPVTGHSMLPMLRAGDHVQVLPQSTYTLGDLLVFVVDNQLIVHRLIGRSSSLPDAVTWHTQGDNCDKADPPNAPYQVLGKVVAIRRGRSTYRIDTRPWRWINWLVGYCTAAATRLPVAGVRRSLLRLVARYLSTMLNNRSVPTTNELCYLLTRQDVDAVRTRIENLVRTTAVDWDRVVDVVASHGVAPLVWHNLEKTTCRGVTVPIAVRERLQRYGYRNIAVKAGVQTKLEAICAFCDAHGVDVMLLKGAALDQGLYDQNWYVEHDVDLLLRFRPQDTDATTRAAAITAIDRYFWTLPGFEYEFNAHHDLTMNGLLYSALNENRGFWRGRNSASHHNRNVSVDIDEIWRDACPIMLGAQQAWVMSPADMLVMAAINSCRKRFFHLKSLLAIATIIERADVLDWNSVVRKASHYGVGAILYSALLVAQSTLGTSCPPHLAQVLVPSLVRLRLIHDVVTYLLRQELPLLTSAATGPRPPDRFALLPYVTYTPVQLLGKITRLIRIR